MRRWWIEESGLSLEELREIATLLVSAEPVNPTRKDRGAAQGAGRRRSPGDPCQQVDENLLTSTRMPPSGPIVR